MHYAWRNTARRPGRALQWWLKQLASPVTRGALLTAASAWRIRTAACNTRRRACAEAVQLRGVYSAMTYNPMETAHAQARATSPSSVPVSQAWLRAHAGTGRPPVTVFEKNWRPGGRMATRSSPFGGFDHGAQYFTVRDSRSQLALADRTGRVQTLERQHRAGAGRARPHGRRRQLPPQEPHWVATPGMNDLPRQWARPWSAQDRDPDPRHPDRAHKRAQGRQLAAARWARTSTGVHERRASRFRRRGAGHSRLAGARAAAELRTGRRWVQQIDGCRWRPAGP
jgi:hypothetical protein